MPWIWGEPCLAFVRQTLALLKPVIRIRAVDALAKAIARLSDNAFLRCQIGAAGCDVVALNFSLRAMTDKVESLYQREWMTKRHAGAAHSAKTP